DRLVLQRNHTREGHPQRTRRDHLRRRRAAPPRSGTGAARGLIVAFPEHIERIFEVFGVPPDTKNAVYELYVAMGEDALEVFGEIAESVDSPTNLRPEHCAAVRARVVERYLTRNHPLWQEGQPTGSLYRPRVLEGRAAGLAIPLGPVQPDSAAVIGEA